MFINIYKHHKFPIACISHGLFLLFISLCYAGIEDRPLDTDDAYTLDKGEFAISTGTVFTTDKHGDKEIDINTDLGYGITDRFEITADFPYVFTDPHNARNREGIGDIAVRLEYMFLEERGNIPAMSLDTTIKFESGDEDKGLGSGDTDYTFFLQLSKSFDPITVHFNFGYTLVGEHDDEILDNVFGYNFAAEYELMDRLTLVGEFLGETNSDPHAEDDPMEFLVGAMYDINSNFTLDAGLGAGLTDASPDVKVTAGITFGF